MGKRTRPQGWGKPTCFKYSSRVQKISRDKGSLAVLDLYKQWWSEAGQQSLVIKM